MDERDAPGPPAEGRETAANGARATEPPGSQGMADPQAEPVPVAGDAPAGAPKTEDETEPAAPPTVLPESPPVTVDGPETAVSSGVANEPRAGEEKGSGTDPVAGEGRPALVADEAAECPVAAEEAANSQEPAIVSAGTGGADEPSAASGFRRTGPQSGELAPQSASAARCVRLSTLPSTEAELPWSLRVTLLPSLDKPDGPSAHDQCAAAEVAAIPPNGTEAAGKGPLETALQEPVPGGHGDLERRPEARDPDSLPPDEGPGHLVDSPSSVISIQDRPATTPSLAPAAALPVLPPSAASEPPLRPTLIAAERALDRQTRWWQPLRQARRWGRRVAVLGMVAFAVWLTAALGQIVLFRYVDPPYSNLMLFYRLTGHVVVQQWLPVERMPAQLVRAIVVSEDGRFCSHSGIDLKEVEAAIERSRDGTPRGASTISMQVAKNLFLWQSKSYIRKALEVPLTLAIEAFWSKRRIFEVYANIAEWGPGVFGVEAASGYHFGKSAARVSEREAALLAVALPNPVVRDAGDPGPGTERLANNIRARMRAMSRAASCIERTPRA